MTRRCDAKKASPVLDRFTHLFRLRTVVEQGSIRKATEVLTVTQPALSRSIAQLEAHFGKPLLVRHSKGVVPTEFGKRVLASADRLSRHWAQEESDLETFGHSIAGRLRLRAGPLWRTVLLPRVVTQLQREFPRLVVEMESGGFDRTIPDLMEGHTDVVFGCVHVADGPERRLIRREFTVVHDRVVAREDHPIFAECKDGELSDAARVLDYPWIVYTADAVYELQTIHATIERLGAPPDIRIRSESLIATLGFLQNGDYLCVLPENAVVGITAPRILTVPVALGHRTIRSGALYREEMADWPPLKRLLALSQEHVEALGP